MPKVWTPARFELNFDRVVKFRSMPFLWTAQRDLCHFYGQRRLDLCNSARDLCCTAHAIYAISMHTLHNLCQKYGQPSGV
jgi:hypothetical protein